MNKTVNLCMIKILILCVLQQFSWSVVFGQKKISNLPSVLSESSGLCFYNDSVLISINDGGNTTELYFLKKTGELIHTLSILNASNQDWEEITTDGNGTFYIGDIGNNENNRKDLCVYIVKGKDLLSKKEISAETIEFQYPDQNAFPPEKNQLNFDAEALVYFNDSLHIITKCRTKPYSGEAHVYSFAPNPGYAKLIQKAAIGLGGRNWKSTSVTGACVFEKKLYLITYRSISVFKIKKKGFEYDSKIHIQLIGQRESIAISASGKIYFTDERKGLIGGNLYTIKN